MLKQLVARPQSISVSADYQILNGRLYAYEARLYRTQSHAIPDIRYEYSNSLIGIANIISYTVYAYICIILLECSLWGHQL